VRRNRLAVVIAAGALGGALGLGASLAMAAPSENASCVAKWVHSEGPPGQTGAYGGPLGGDAVSSIAQLPKEECSGGQTS
jgi:hypothetical protein